MTRIIKPLLKDFGDWLLATKPSNYNTHSPDYGKKGFLELCEDEYQKKLYPVHRLDKETSGLLLIAKTPELAKDLTQLFEKHQVHKEYLFLTSQQCDFEKLQIKSFIQKKQNLFVSEKSDSPNSETEFHFLQKIGNHFLWRALPKTGKPHQIRLHAADLGIPVLGDQEHGGTSWPQMCLHSDVLKFSYHGQLYSFESVRPLWAQVPLDRDEVLLCKAFDRREFVYGFSQLSDQSLRLSHLESEKYRIDQFGPQWWIYWYDEADPQERDLEIFNKWSQFYQKEYLIRKMLNRGQDPTTAKSWTSPGWKPLWEAKENEVSYQLRSDRGLSPGLFLDQRENRYWVSRYSDTKNVLNLFSYTSGFSVVSALSEAAHVVSVDVSQNFLDWSKDNFKLNNLDPEKFEFWCNDVLLFLKGCYRRKRKFDLIICDPPSFGRSKEGVFNLSKQWETLLTSCLFVLNRRGLILFSNNYEGWDSHSMRKSIGKISRDFSIQLTDATPPGWDYETPDEELLMKSVVIRKN